MKALTLWQPFASLIACGAKRYETRDWPPPRHLIGQTIAIHAGRDRFEPHQLVGAAASINGALKHVSWHALPSSMVICTARLSGAYRVATPMRPALTGHIFDVDDIMGIHADTIAAVQLWPGEEDFGNYAMGRWLFALTEVRPITPPQQARGFQKFWEWKETLHA